MGDECHDIPILLIRPFLKPSRTKIGAYGGTLAIELDGEVIKLNIFDGMRFPADVNDFCTLYVIDELSQDVYELPHEDELLTTLIQGLEQFVFQSYLMFGHDVLEFYTSFYLDLAQIIGKLGYLFVFSWFCR